MTQIKYAGFSIRLVADFIDSFILDVASCLATLMLLGIIYWTRILWGVEGVSEVSLFKVLDPFVMQMVLVFFRVGLSLPYFVWLTYRFGTTLGKRCFRVYVVPYSTDSQFNLNGKLTLSQSLVRCVGYLVSYLPFGAGFLMACFQPQKRALHDLIAGTVCVVRPKVG